MKTPSSLNISVWHAVNTKRTVIPPHKSQRGKAPSDSSSAG